MSVISKVTIAAAHRYNEAEIRFHIVDPILRNLGYPDEKNTYLFLEEKLEYPFSHIGRRSKKDVPLGFADYRAGIEGARGSFIVEAKAGGADINQKEVEQAHSYAAHAQVGANYFVLCNGKVICVYETLSGPNPPPIVKLPLSELNRRFHELENILSPASLEKNCRVSYDKNLKLAKGLGSIATVRSGHYRLSDYEIRLIANGRDCTQWFRSKFPRFAEIEKQIELFNSAFEMQVSEGIAWRDDDGTIVADVEFKGVTIHNKEAMKTMRIDKARFATADEFLSIDPKSPTVFETRKDFSLSRGTILPELFGGAAALTNDVLGNMFIKVAMFYGDGVMSGEYIALADQEFLTQDMITLRVEVDMVGTLELVIDK